MFALLGCPRFVFEREELSELGTRLVSSIVQYWEPGCKFHNVSSQDRSTDAIISRVKSVISEMETKCKEGDIEEDEDQRGKSNWLTVIPLAMIEINKVPYSRVFGVELATRKTHDEEFWSTILDSPTQSEERYKQSLTTSL